MSAITSRPMAILATLAILAIALITATACSGSPPQQSADSGAIDTLHRPDASADAKVGDATADSSHATVSLRWTFAVAASGESLAFCRGAACDKHGRCLASGEAKAGRIDFAAHSERLPQTTGYLWPIESTDPRLAKPALWAGTSGVDIDMQKDRTAIFAGTIGAPVALPSKTLRPSHGQRDAFFMAVGVNGALRFGSVFGSAGNDAVNEIATGPQDEIVVVDLLDRTRRARWFGQTARKAPLPAVQTTSSSVVLRIPAASIGALRSPAVATKRRAASASPPTAA
jgi:hypothetical protein